MTKFYVVEDMVYVTEIGEFESRAKAQEYAEKELPFSTNVVYSEEQLTELLSNAQDALRRVNNT